MSDKEVARKRIVSKVNYPKSGCWEWKLSIRENGYARTTFKGDNWYLHRLSYWAFIGDIPDGHDVCHKCDNRKCCNPNHLFVGTRKDNMEDAVSKGRQARGLALPQAKLSDEDISKILSRIHSGELYKNIAKDFNVTRHSIGRVAINNGIRRGKGNGFKRC